jgi:hypothetical protein
VAEIGLLPFPPVVLQQNATAAFSEPIPVVGATSSGRSLQKATVTEAQKVGVELPALSKRKVIHNLPWPMPASITERFEHQELQFAAPSHARSLTEIVSTSLFCGTSARNRQKVERNSKSLLSGKPRFSGFSISNFYRIYRNKGL